MKISINRTTIFSFLVAFFILYVLVTSVNLRRTLEIMGSVDIGVYLLAASIFFISFLLRTIRWKILLESIGFSGRLRDVLEIMILSFFVNLLIPAKIGDVYRGYLVKKNYKEPISRVMGTVFVERSFEVIAMVLLLSTVILLFFKEMPSNLMSSLKVGAVLAVLLAIFLIIVKNYNERLFRFIPRRGSNIFKTFGKGTSDTLTSSSISVVSTCTILIWLLDSTEMFLVMRAVGLDVSFSLAVFVTLAGALAAVFPLTPGGLGAVELTVSGLLVLLGIDKDLAVSIALLERFISYWFFILVGGSVYVFTKKK